MKKNYTSKVTYLKPPCFFCGEFLNRPAQKLSGRDVCPQCLEGHRLFRQNAFLNQQIKHGHLSLRGGLIHGQGASS